MTAQKLTLRQLERGVSRVGRCLMTPHPDYANSALLAAEQIGEITSRPGARPNQWFRVERETPDGIRVGHILINQDGSGKYLRELPPGVDPKTVPTVRSNVSDLPVTDMARHLRDLITALATQGTEKFASGEIVQFTGNAIEHAALLPLRQRLDGVLAASKPGYEETKVAEIGGAVQMQMMEMIKTKSLDGVRKSVAAGADAALALRAQLAAPCGLAAWFVMYRDTSDAIRAECLARGMSAQQADAMYIRYVGTGCPIAIKNPAHLAIGIADKMAREGLHETAERIALGYRERGRSLIEQAMAAKTTDPHDAALYEAAVPLFNGICIFKGLTQKEHKTIDADTTKRYLQLARDCEEYHVRATSALVNAYEDRAGAKLANYRYRIAKCAKSGEKAVKDYLFDLLDRKYYYPRSYEKVLRDPKIPDPDGA